MNDTALVSSRGPARTSTLRMRRFVKSAQLAELLGDTRGAGLVEYIILVGLIALAALAGFQYFGTQVNTKARNLGDRVTNEIK